MENISTKKVLSLEEAAEYSGYKKSYLQKLTSGGVISHSKPNGKSIFFNREELEAWLLRNPRKGLVEIKEEEATYITTQK